MIDTKKARDIVRALRCTRSIAMNYKKAKTVCPEWSETITDDAAEMIEALLADNERMSDLLMVMRIKMTGDCGVCRHQHVNVRDEPCASCIMTEGRDGWQYEGDEEHGEP